MSTMLTNLLKTRLDELKELGLMRHHQIMHRTGSSKVMVEGKLLTNFTSNDYLNLSQHPQLKEALIEGVNEFGIGASASAQVSGYHAVHAQLEKKFAEFLGRERAVILPSGYHANLAALTALTDKNGLIIADKFCHASLLDGMQLSRAKWQRYRHANYEEAARLIASAKEQCFLVTESVFSMEGAITKIDRLATLCKRHGAALIVDDAHGFGVLGKEGRGICEHFQLSDQDVPVLITPFGKAMGSMGAMISGNALYIEAILQYAKSYRYTTALPPALAYATLVGLSILQKEVWRREKVWSLTRYFIAQALKYQLTLSSLDVTPIKSILLHDNYLVLQVQRELIKAGFLVAAIRPPTVPKGTARLRISINAALTEDDIDQLLARIHELVLSHG